MMYYIDSIVLVVIILGLMDLKKMKSLNAKFYLIFFILSFVFYASDSLLILTDIIRYSLFIYIINFKIKQLYEKKS